MARNKKWLQGNLRHVPGACLLLCRSWPRRAYLYATLRERGVDVHGAEHPAEARSALRQWPRRFALLLFDAADYSSDEASQVIALCERAGLEGLTVCGPFESARLPSPLPKRMGLVRKPISVGELVRLVQGRL